MQTTTPSDKVSRSTLFDGENAAYLEALYEDFLREPSRLDPVWRQFFEQSFPVSNPNAEPLHSEIQMAFKRLAHTSPSVAPPSGPQTNPSAAPTPAPINLQHARQEFRVAELIESYRLLGHLHAALDPLNLHQKPLVPELMLGFYQFGDKDLETEFETENFLDGKKRSLKRLVAELQTIYCGPIGWEFMHITDSPERVWVENQIENLQSRYSPTLEDKRLIFKMLIAAEGLEKYLHAKYPGAVRFSLEGCDSLMVALDALIQKSAETGAKEMVIGMAHRGRLNVLTNILGRSPGSLFDEFEGKYTAPSEWESGDVKYHLGFSSDINTPFGELHLALAFNPSHLEIVNPVVTGSVRARQDRRKDYPHSQVVCVTLHGDASFAGQGVVMETLNMSKTPGFEVGGTIHLITNNQIGFTTTEPDSRSTVYCSDLGKMLGIPIFHVNADSPEAVFLVSKLAIAYKAQFKKDVIIDLIGYRRFGHNEADEPAATQPLMYQVIRKLPTVVAQYKQRLIEDKIFPEADLAKAAEEYRALLDSRQEILARNVISNAKGLPKEFSSDWTPYLKKDWRTEAVTAVKAEILQQLAQKLEVLPPGFELHPQVAKMMEQRRLMTAGKLPVNWGYAEIMAYASLLNEGYTVRLTGQDCRRGTFFHRHAVVHDQKTGAEYTPLSHLSAAQGRFSIFDSILSETAVMGFEYGYSTTEPKNLTLWEAQYGDFANNAQTVIDQFITSGEQKWGRLSGLTLLLPHGYEGAGPEHSSSRIERFLSLCAEDNIQVCVPSNPSQLFHLLRRQLIRPVRKPLIVITPKKLLHNKLVVSSLQDLSTGSFLPVLSETPLGPPETIKRIMLCTGKTYYDLLEFREKRKILDTTIIRVEQLYPFPEVELQTALKPYSQAKELVWCQEEPQNQGPWYNSQHHLRACLAKDQQLRYAGRKPAAAPAGGYVRLHQLQLESYLKDAFGIKEG